MATSVANDIVSQFADLFEGRKDAYGSGAVAGACIRVDDLNDWNVHIWPYHLNGNRPIGIYPMVLHFHAPNYNLPTEGEARWEVKWGCVDLDIRSDKKPSGDYESEEECHTAAVNLQKVLKHLGVTSWIERTRSGGRHLWVFASTWTLSAVMRRSLIVAASVAGVSSREVNPKQESLAQGQLGNYVRLPYPYALGDPAKYLHGYKQWMIGEDGHSWWPLETFVVRALAARTFPQTLEAIASKWKVPERERVPFDGAMLMHSGMVAEILLQLNRAGHSVFANGPNDGDRSRGLAYLARQAHNSGLTPSEALTLLAAAPWQKFRGRHDEEQRLREIVEWAWQ